jgi:LPXTG-motif cell wall-anchored protein
MILTEVTGVFVGIGVVGLLVGLFVFRRRRKNSQEVDLIEKYMP